MWALSTTGFSSQTQTAALLIWVMTHEIISSKRSVANDYFLLIDWNPIIFLMLSVCRKLCPSDTTKNNTYIYIYVSQTRVMLSIFHWDKPNHVATQSALLSLPSLPFSPLCAPVHILHLFLFCLVAVQSAVLTSVLSFPLCQQLTCSEPVLQQSWWKQRPSVLGIVDGKTKAYCCWGS